MFGLLSRTAMVLRAIVHELRTERITFMAGSVAFGAFVSLLPLVFLLLWIVSAVGNRELEAALVSTTEAVVTPGAAEVVVTELRATSTGASIVGVVVLVWGMLRIFRTLDTAFSRVYETQSKNTLGDRLRDGIVVFGSLAVVVVVALVVGSALPSGVAFGDEWLVQRGVLVLVVALALVPFYYLFPDESGMSVREVVPGVLVTATLLVATHALFGLYVEYSREAAESTTLASILLFLTWLYVSGLVVLAGAAINAVLSNRSEDVNVSPLIGGVPKAPVSGFETDGEPSVPEETLEQLSHALGEAGEVRITVDGDEEFTVPAPDVASVDTDTSPIPAINDTASLDVEWSQYGGLDEG